jgi:hypothetical protein
VNQKKLRKRLKWLWDNRTFDVGMTIDGSLERWRYVPQSLNGGTGWGVFDRLQDRFLTDEELVALPMEKVQTATHLS